MTRRLAGSLILGCLLAVSGCGGRNPEPSSPTSDVSGNGGAQEDLQFACADIGFPVDRLLAIGAENGGDAPAAALRAAIATRDARGPRSGWVRIAQTATIVQFAVREAVFGPDRSWHLVQFRLENGAWTLFWSGECRLSPVLPVGFGSGEWWVAGSLRPSDRTISAVVREPGCSKGPIEADRIGQPIIAHRPKEVKVIVPVRVPANLDECRLGPTPFTFDIGEPIGNRTLLDGHVFPARDARLVPRP